MKIFSNLYNSIKSLILKLYAIRLVRIGVVTFLLIWGVIFTFNQFTYTRIMAKFDEMRPVHNKLYVYYKGMKVGHAGGIKTSPDFTFTTVKIILYPRNLILPNNMSVILKVDKKGRKIFDILELVYPEVPSKTLLKNWDTIEGKTTIDLESYASNQDPESLNQIKSNMADSAKNLNNATSALTDLLVTLNELVKENSSSIKVTTENLAQTTGNLTQSTDNLTQTTVNFNSITKKVDTSIQQQQLNSTMTSLENSLDNLKEVTKNVQVITETVDGTTKTVNSNTMPKIENTIEGANCIVSNLCEITGGVSDTLKKRFGGMRLLFGKTIQDTCKK